MMSNYCPAINGLVKQGVRNGFRIIQKKKVVMYVEPMIYLTHIIIMQVTKVELSI
jgi:hypothetical protein